MCVANSKVIFKAQNPLKRVRTEKFRLHVIEGLLEGYVKPSQSFSRQVNNPGARLTEKHFVSLNPKLIGGGRRSCPDCEVCSDRSKKRHQTTYFCQQCNVPLCAYPCFQRFHTLQNCKTDCTNELHK